MSNGLAGVRADQRCSYSSLEKVAARIRENLNYPIGTAIKALDLFENLHKVAIKMRGGRLIRLEGGVIALEDSEGYTRYNGSKNVIEILASEQTYMWLEIGHPRGTYFVAHELGHCVLHTDQLVRLAQLPTQQQEAFHRGRADHKPYEDTEWQANALASALLMPAAGLQLLEGEHDELDASIVADKFGVSYEAAGYRLELFNNRRNELLR
jgi:Zn-dependent peptidase ImmA (M78 family)